MFISGYAYLQWHDIRTSPMYMIYNLTNGRRPACHAYIRYIMHGIYWIETGL